MLRSRYNASSNITFSVVSGPGRIWTTHNGDPANDHPRDVSWVPAYHGLARACDPTEPGEPFQLLQVILQHNWRTQM